MPRTIGPFLFTGAALVVAATVVANPMIGRPSIMASQTASPRLV
jgi:hypothetical protein